MWTRVGNDDGSHASTTSVPLRGAVTIVSAAPIRSARSCMLIIPKPLELRSLANPRPSSATDNRTPIARTADTRQLLRLQGDRYRRRHLHTVDDALQRRGERLRLADVWPQGSNRPPRFDHVRAREINRRFELVCDRGDGG